MYSSKLPQLFTANIRVSISQPIIHLRLDHRSLNIIKTDRRISRVWTINSLIQPDLHDGNITSTPCNNEEVKEKLEKNE